MEKIRLKNQTVLEFKEIEDNLQSVQLTFIDKELADLKLQFDDKNNLTIFEILTDGDVVCAEYNNYVLDKYTLQDTEITVSLIKLNETELRIATLEEKIKAQESAIDTLILESLEV